MLPVSPLRLKKGCDEAVRKGAPWIYASDIIDSSQLLSVPAGSLVAIENHKGQPLGTGYYNPRSQIACRVLTTARETIDAVFFKTRFAKALVQRQLIGVPYYRLVHSEGDYLPGLLVDRFGGILVIQVGTAGMEFLTPLWLPTLEELIAPDTIILRNDSAARRLEGLSEEISIIKGTVPDRVEVQENGCIYYADLMHGQKTGWFYDQRDNRAMIASLAAGKTVADIYSHSGGFGVLAAKRGAKSVVMADSSKLALDLAGKASVRNGVDAVCSTVQGDAFELMQQWSQAQKTFDIVLADPPAFVKTRRDIAAGLKGYEKIARLAAPLVAPGGLLFVASCSHYAGRSAFNKAVLDGAAKSSRIAEILKQTGAGSDHPRHRLLPQSEYLKGLLLKLR